MNYAELLDRLRRGLDVRPQPAIRRQAIESGHFASSSTHPC